jgi:hypothetical protein
MNRDRDIKIDYAKNESIKSENKKKNKREEEITSNFFFLK